MKDATDRVILKAKLRATKAGKHTRRPCGLDARGFPCDDIRLNRPEILNFHINMLRHVVSPLVVPTPIRSRAELLQNGQLCDATAICPSILPGRRFMPFFGCCNWNVRRFRLRMSRLKNQRRHSAFLYTLDRPDSDRRGDAPSVRDDGEGWRKAGHISHGVLTSVNIRLPQIEDVFTGRNIDQSQAPVNAPLAMRRRPNFT